MARLARIVAPGCPHHVTARGDRREPIFFEDGPAEPAFAAIRATETTGRKPATAATGQAKLFRPGIGE